MRVYLDHAATTPPTAAARAAMAEGLACWANPSSPHVEGRAARAALERARGRIAAALGWRHALIFTSGTSEAAAIALGRRGERPLLASAVEHAAVLRQRPDALVPVDADGLVDKTALPVLMAAHPGALVAVQHVNSETGVIQPLPEVGAIVRAGGGLLFADCAQSAGKLPLPDADLIAISAHKLGGPPGIGALLVRDLSMIIPEGGQEQGYRAGTENLPAALGFAAAIEDGAEWVEPHATVRRQLDAAIREGGGMVICQTTPRSPLIASYHMPGVAAAAQLIRFDLMGFAVSAGSACSSGSLKPSHVLDALGLGAAAGEVIRVSFGRDTGAEDVASFARAWRTLADEARTRRAA